MNRVEEIGLMFAHTHSHTVRSFPPCIVCHCSNIGVPSNRCVDLWCVQDAVHQSAQSGTAQEDSLPPAHVVPVSDKPTQTAR